MFEEDLVGTPEMNLKTNLQCFLAHSLTSAIAAKMLASLARGQRCTHDKCISRHDRMKHQLASMP